MNQSAPRIPSLMWQSTIAIKSRDRTLHMISDFAYIFNKDP